MDRVLQRVGLVKRSAGTTADCASAPSADPRRRRPKTRRRSTAQSMTKSSGGGLFNFDWDYVRECRSCKSRALLGRRFCYKKCDNALYRSNSFKFERFERSSGASETTGTGFEPATCTLSKQIAVCDHYSIPADDLCKPDTEEAQHVSARSLAPSVSGPALSDWNISSSNEEKVDILDTYSTPKDNRVPHIQPPQNDLKYFTSPEREYSQPYTTDKSSEPVSDDDFFGCPDQSILCKLSDLNSPDSISEALPASTNLLQTPIKCTPRKQPSPYYYSDLLNKPPVAETTQPPAETNTNTSSNQHQASLPLPLSACFKKQRSTLDAPHYSHGQKTPTPTTTSYHKKYRRSLPPEDRLYHHHHHQASAKLYSRSQNQQTIPASLPPCSYLPCTCPSGVVHLCDEQEDGDDEMSRQRRHVYETAFDSRISKSDDDLDQIDRVSNHPVLHNSVVQQRPSTSFAHKLTSYSLGRRKLRQQQPQQTTVAVNALSQKLQRMQLPNAEAPAPRGYSTSPPSTAPLPIKFTDKEFIMNSIRSTPNLPSNPRGCYKDSNTVTLPTKLFANGPKMRSNEIKEKSPNSSNSACDVQYGESSKVALVVGRPKTSLGVFPMPREDIKEIKDRPPRKKQHGLVPMKHRSKTSSGKDQHQKTKRQPKHKYSSTESMTTVSNSSSDGSMESIKSSTSEGNRSTTSTDSRHSCSISSHDSDSGALNTFQQLLAAQPTVAQLHILSPISDKSSQEPFSETSDYNRNNNETVREVACASALCGADVKAQRRRVAQNKNLLNLGCFRHKDSHYHSHHHHHETAAAAAAAAGGQGSDSGISIQSREGGMLLTVRPAKDTTMGKVRDCASDSATSIDLGELPFDMPKLRRRLRVQQSELSMSLSQASSSQSVAGGETTAAPPPPRPKLSLNLCGKVSSVVGAGAAGLALAGLKAKSPQLEQRNIVDVTLPLEKQAWFHGAITRVEAENVLRLLEEGSFLVRNSESTKQDYSLSLKSARGYMHMRIQRSETEVVNGGSKSFILGQFSKPFSSIPEMIRHFSLNGLPIRGAEHMCLIQPVIAQLL